MTDLAKTAEIEGLTHAEAAEALKAAAKRKHAPPKPSAVMSMAQVARALGKPTRWVRRKLIAAGVAHQDHPGGHWEVTRNDLRVYLRKYWVEVELEAASR